VLLAVPSSLFHWRGGVVVPGNYRRRNERRIWVAVLICALGMFLGGLLAHFLGQNFETIRWASIALEIGTENPWQIASPLIDASILLRVRFNIGSLLGLIIGLLIYRMGRR